MNSYLALLWNRGSEMVYCILVLVFCNAFTQFVPSSLFSVYYVPTFCPNISLKIWPTNESVRFFKGLFTDSLVKFFTFFVISLFTLDFFSQSCVYGACRLLHPWLYPSFKSMYTSFVKRIKVVLKLLILRFLNCCSLSTILRLIMPETEIRKKANQEKFHSGALARAKRARSGAPWVRKFGKLSFRENFYYDVAYARPPAHPYTHIM